MRKSIDKKTQAFIDNINVIDHAKYQILIKLREVVFEHYPKVEEKIMYGGIIFIFKEGFCGVFVYRNHVSFEFSNGYKFEDPENLLEGKGKYRRHLKFKSIEDIKTKTVDYFLKQTISAQY
ncbi:MAG: DUF1801 domain-containing protein [Maribacter sp.]|nr:DUF1801 domain-containing protein [Maribacter sp.]MBT8302799.1 DUF1801 domain-containing protein [Maribacter sp.]